MPYTKTNWQDAPSTLTAINASRLNNLETQYDRAVEDITLSMHTVNVKDFGALGDGTTDDQGAIQAAVTACPDGGTVIVPPGTYRIAGGAIRNVDSLGARKTVRISAYGAKFIQDQNARIFEFWGEWETTYTVSALTNTTLSEGGNTVKSTDLTVSGTLPWRRGDIIKVFSDDVLPDSRSDAVTPPANASRTAQFFSVISTSTNKVTVIGRPIDPFVTNVRVARMKPITIAIHGGEYQMVDGWLDLGYTASMFSFSSLRAPVLRDMRVSQAGTGVYNMVSCYGYLILNCEVNWARNDTTDNGFGYGVSDNVSWFGSVIGCRFTQPRHGYTTTSSSFSAGNTNPALYGRVFASRVIGSNVDGSSGSAFDTHGDSQDVHFIGCHAMHCDKGFTLRGRENHVLDCTVRHCGQALMLYSESSGGASWGHVVDGFDVRDVSSMIYATFNGSSNNLNYGAIESRGITIQNVTATEVTGPLIERALNAVVYMNNVYVSFKGAVSSNVIYLEHSNLYANNIRLEYFDTTGGGSQNMIEMQTTTDSLAEINGLRIRGFSAMSSRIARVFLTDASVNHAVRATNVHIDYMPGAGIYNLGMTASSWVDYIVSTAGTNSSFLAVPDGSITNATALKPVGWTMADRITLECTLTTSRTLAALPSGKKHGQLLLIYNNGGGSGSLTIAQGATGNTSLIGGTNKVISSGNCLMLMWSSAASAWRQVALT